MSTDVVIVGAGLAGSAAAWSLTRSGHSVTLVEQFEPGHTRGSSHGTARIVRRGYGDELYARLTGEAFELWNEVQRASGSQLLRLLGGIDFGPARPLQDMAGHFTRMGVAHELLPAAEAELRWPGMRFEGDVLFHEQAGVLDADGAVSAFVGLAREAGADVRYSNAAVSITPDGDVALGDGTTVHGEVVVVAAGAWVAELLGSTVTLPPLRVTEQSTFHFPRLDPSQPPWPSVIHEFAADWAVYHLAGGGALDERKIGDHQGGVEERSGVASEAQREAITRYVEQWLPGLDAARSSGVTCLYTNTPSEDFVIDRVGNVVVASPCSGHGAKFAALVGEYVTALVDGRRDVVPERFALDTHLAYAAGSPVSL